MELPAQKPPALLDDDRVREFIANGFVRLTPDVAPPVHEEVDALLRHACERETWYGNNILPRVPQMHAVLDCPVVRGALISLLGEGYYLHPHRAVHTSTPVELDDAPLTPETNAPPMGKGSAAGSGWHQDAPKPAFPRPPPCAALPHRLLLSARRAGGDGANAHTSRQPLPRAARAAERRGAGRNRRRHVPAAAFRHGSRGLSQPHGAHPLHGEIRVHAHPRAARAELEPRRSRVAPPRRLPAGFRFAEHLGARLELAARRAGDAGKTPWRGGEC